MEKLFQQKQQIQTELKDEINKLKAENEMLKGQMNKLLENNSNMNKKELPDKNILTPLPVCQETPKIEIKEENVTTNIVLANSNIWEAASNGSLESIEKIIKEEPKLINRESKEFDYKSPLYLASENGHLSTMKFLIDNGAKVDWKCSQDLKTPLYGAALRGEIEVVKFLVEKGAKVDMKCSKDKSTPLHAAAMNGHRAVVEFLRNNAKARIDVMNEKDNKRLLDLALEKGRLNVVECYFLLSPKINASVTLLKACKYPHLDIVEFLVDNGADVNYRDKNFWNYTPLHWAAINGHLEIARFLISCDADHKALDRNWNTALYYARQNKHSALEQYLNSLP